MTKPSDLTEREVKLLELISTGMSNKAIGALMGLTEQTTKTYVSWLFRKLGLDNRTSAALWYLTLTGRLRSDEEMAARSVPDELQLSPIVLPGVVER